MAGYVHAVLYNGLGRYDEALAGAQLACEHDDLGILGFALVELIEAAARAAMPELAAEALRELEDRTLAAGTDWALGILARSRALLSDGDVAEALYLEAIERLDAPGSSCTWPAPACCMASGCGARTDGSTRATNFESPTRCSIGSGPKRSPSEPAASCSPPARRRANAPSRRATCSPHRKRRSPGSLREGHTNPEIGSQLFISPRTVEYHLSKVFTKLGISSRRDLRRALPEIERTAVSN